MSTKKIEAKVYLTAQERDRLDREAARLSVSRGQLIRERALAASGPVAIKTPNMQIYSAAVDKAARVASGVPRPHLEAIVAATLQTLMESCAAA